MAPQIIMICLAFGAFVVHCVKYDEPITEKFNPVRKLISIAIAHSILYCGGFYDVLLK